MSPELCKLSDVEPGWWQNNWFIRWVPEGPISLEGRWTLQEPPETMMLIITGRPQMLDWIYETWNIQHGHYEFFGGSLWNPSYTRPFNNRVYQHISVPYTWDQPVITEPPPPFWIN